MSQTPSFQTSQYATTVKLLGQLHEMSNLTDQPLQDVLKASLQELVEEDLPRVLQTPKHGRTAQDHATLSLAFAYLHVQMDDWQDSRWVQPEAVLHQRILELEKSEELTMGFLEDLEATCKLEQTNNTRLQAENDQVRTENTRLSLLADRLQMENARLKLELDQARRKSKQQDEDVEDALKEALIMNLWIKRAKAGAASPAMVRRLETGDLSLAGSAG